MKILISVPYTSCVIMSVILMITLFKKALILQEKFHVDHSYGLEG